MFNNRRTHSQSVEIVAPQDNWILQRIGDELAERLSYCRVVEQPSGKTPIGYYVNYAISPDQRVYEKELAWFTHLEEEDESRVSKFFAIASKIDVAISQSELYSRVLRERISELRIEVIPPGVDLDRFHLRPIRIGIVGRNYDYTPRKGDHVLRQVWDIPGIEFVVTGSGWTVPHQYLTETELPNFYRSLDYLLIPSLWEGGPMSAIEALAVGVPVIAPPVGWMSELPHLEYPAGDIEALRVVLHECVLKKQQLRAAVLDRTWDEFARKHDEVFSTL